jgi:hypothetical protein
MYVGEICNFQGAFSLLIYSRYHHPCMEALTGNNPFNGLRFVTLIVRFGLKSDLQLITERESFAPLIPHTIYLWTFRKEAGQFLPLPENIQSYSI